MTNIDDNLHLTALGRECLEEWGYTSLTDIQTKAIDAGVPTGESAIVCAPTSSGKTLVGELALAHSLIDGHDALYLVSHKALAEQKYVDFCERFATPRWGSSISVGLSTGDREEGDVSSRILMSTYEKALGLLLAGRLNTANTVLIADELQLIGDPHRGASVETLCALLRQAQIHQFVGLTATIENPEDLAAWMNCVSLRSDTRDVDLLQSIRYGGRLYTVLFGQDAGDETDDPYDHDDLHGVIHRLIADGFGPALVFVETRREAAELAAKHAERCQRSSGGLKISQQLELFSEPTESSSNLMAHAERLVVFHTADLTADERQVIETGFSSGDIQVCFATSTLAAGVNFPFRTVVFPKLTYQYGDREETMITRSDYRNMSGRAGRLGLHEDGRVLLLPTNKAELAHANVLVAPENDRVESQLVSLSMRRTVLALVAAKAVSSRTGLHDFFDSTLYRHLLLEHNPKKLEQLVATACMAIDWLLQNGFIEESHSTLLPTPLGKSTALSGLLPETARLFVDLLASKGDELASSFDDYPVALIHWAATCPEFVGDRPSRFLPYPAGKAKPDSSQYMRGVPHLVAWDRTDDRTTRCVHAIGLFLDGTAERKIRFPTGVSSGQVHRLSEELSWVIEGLSRISGTPELAVPQTLTNQLAMLSRRVRWGAPVDAIDLLRIAKRKQVPGFGRQRAMSLLANGLSTILDVLGAGKERLAKLLDSERRAGDLVIALSDHVEPSGVSYERKHMELARELGVEQKVAECNSSLDTDYEDAIYALLREETQWVVDQLDDGKRQNVPDLQLSLGDVHLLIECKTVTKKPPLIKKEEAFAVLQKAVDFDDSMRRVTLGKPDFDEHSKGKAAAATTITLIQHRVFMEGMMRVLTGRLSPEQFVDWLAAPGVTELSRLPGTPTYQELDAGSTESSPEQAWAPG